MRAQDMVQVMFCDLIKPAFTVAACAEPAAKADTAMAKAKLVFLKFMFIPVMLSAATTGFAAARNTIIKNIRRSIDSPIRLQDGQKREKSHTFWPAAASATVHILEPHNVVFTQIAARLHFNHF